MALLRLLGIFGFIALLAGCNVSDDVKALSNKVEMVRTDLAQFKDDVAQLRKALVAVGHRLQPCKVPEQQSDITCYYKLEILEVKDNGLYQGKVPDSVIREANDRCRTGNSDPKQCVDYGDTNPYKFFINGPTKYEKGNVVECTNDPTKTKNNDPNPNRLNCTLDKTMKKT